ncbi:hypothetical protein ApDm4_0689 [Acetobacter pomorum]|nr:hypothetical protein ApDm4_0689 [Acetobacter pomorum]
MLVRPVAAHFTSFCRKRQLREAAVFGHTAFSIAFGVFLPKSGPFGYT